MTAQKAIDITKRNAVTISMAGMVGLLMFVWGAASEKSNADAAINANTVAINRNAADIVRMQSDIREALNKLGDIRADIAAIRAMMFREVEK